MLWQSSRPPTANRKTTCEHAIQGKSIFQYLPYDKLTQIEGAQLNQFTKGTQKRDAVTGSLDVNIKRSTAGHNNYRVPSTISTLALHPDGVVQGGGGGCPPVEHLTFDIK